MDSGDEDGRWKDAVRDHGSGWLAGYLGSGVRVSDATSRGTPGTTTCRLCLETVSWTFTKSQVVECTKISSPICTKAQRIHIRWVGRYAPLDID